ncbi:MAG: cupin domain-containing protein [Chloroflexota bacterium]|nr:cupin domain-containing protein [Chloroflexota bacterium]
MSKANGSGAKDDFSWSKTMDPDTYFKSMIPNDTRPGVWRWKDIQGVLDDMDKYPKRYPAYRRFCALVNEEFDGAPGASPAIFMGVQRIHPGEHVTPHRHNSVAIYYWIQGSGKAIVGDHEIRFQAGDFFSCPAWHSHEFFNDGTEDMVMIAVHDLPLLAQLRALFWQEPIGNEHTQHMVKEKAASWTPLEGRKAVEHLPTITATTKG